MRWRGEEEEESLHSTYSGEREEKRERETVKCKQIAGAMECIENKTVHQV